MNEQLLKKISANVEGRDFIVGDLHGCFDELFLLMKHVGFDSKKDRLFSTGDLIDRGPKPLECLDLLNQPWFYPVLGNHEEILINKIKLIENGQFTQLTEEDIEVIKGVQKKELLPKITQMPLMYEIEHILHDKIYIVHAEILPEHIDSKFEQKDGDEINEKYNQFFDLMKKTDLSEYIHKFFSEIKEKDINSFSSGLKQKLIWSRKIVGSFYKENKNSIDAGDFSFIKNYSFEQNTKIFCGHNVVPFPMKIGQQHYIDTGAALGYSEKQINSNLFTQFGHEFFALSLVDLSTGLCYGCITNSDHRGKIVRLETSIYNTK